MRSPNCILLILFFGLLPSCQFTFNDNADQAFSKSRRGISKHAGFATNNQVRGSGVAIEQQTAPGSFENGYNNDNQIYLPGRTWRFKLSTAQHNEQKAFEVKANGEWQLVPLASRSKMGWKRVAELRMEVLDGFGPYANDFNQTLVKYAYIFSNGRSNGDEAFTGLVENSSNVWLPPLRQDFFEVLALNPYPFVQQPVEVGKRFDLDLPVYDNWSNPKWKKWFGTLKNDCRYEIVKQRKLEMAFGTVFPYAILSNCENELGDTGLIAYFDESLGFVKLDYRNIDGSWVSLELLERPY